MRGIKPYRILVFRFSSLGDVAMTIPVIQCLLEQNQKVEVIYVSREKFKPLFENLDHVRFVGADLDGKHKGIWGLYRLFQSLFPFNISAVADLHNVLRTQILVRFFNLKNIPVSVLDKGRKERQALLQGEIKEPIKPMVERYADVFRSLGFDLKLSHQILANKAEKENAIGIAPFAMYKGKMYPLKKMQEVALKIAERGVKVYLFGGKDEATELEKWEKLHPNLTSTAGKKDLKEELELIKKLKLMVSMDSANMHLASLVGTPVISIWGNTHPYMGFLGYGQSMDNVVQDETIKQRPTSVFGKEKSKSEEMDYFKNISPKMISDKIFEALQSNP